MQYKTGGESHRFTARTKVKRPTQSCDRKHQETKRAATQAVGTPEALPARYTSATHRPCRLQYS